MGNNNLGKGPRVEEADLGPLAEDESWEMTFEEVKEQAKQLIGKALEGRSFTFIEELTGAPVEQYPVDFPIFGYTLRSTAWGKSPQDMIKWELTIGVSPKFWHGEIQLDEPASLQIYCTYMRGVEATGISLTTLSPAYDVSKLFTILGAPVVPTMLDGFLRRFRQLVEEDKRGSFFLPASEAISGQISSSPQAEPRP